MTVIRKRTGDNGGCCNPYSELQLEIERVDQTAIDAKTTANNTEAHLGSIESKVNEAIAVVPQVKTNTEAIAAHAAELMDHDAKINANTIVNDQQNTDIATLKTKTNDNAAAIETIENEVGPETVAGTIQYRLKDIDTKLPTAIKEVEMIANASTVTHKATHISGTAESDALPVVSREQAGIMSASVYAAMEDVIANNTSRISVLEQSAPTYDITGLVGPNPTNAEISTAFQQKYPNVPIQSGLRAADYDNAHFWQYGKNTWILLTQIDVQMATNQSLGTVKGSNTDGKIFVETDGSMSLKGYDALVSKDATLDSKIGTLETGLSNANARIDATNTNVANNAQDIATANGSISTNTNDISGLKNRMATAEGQIATHDTKINQHTQSINGLSTDVNGLKTDINGLKTDVNGIKTDVNGLKTDVNGLKQKDETLEGTINNLSSNVNNLSSDVNNLKTGKQDKLIAGDGISIGSDGKTISASKGNTYSLGVVKINTPESRSTAREASQQLSATFIPTEKINNGYTSSILYLNGIISSGGTSTAYYLKKDDITNSTIDLSSIVGNLSSEFFVMFSISPEAYNKILNDGYADLPAYSNISVPFYDAAIGTISNGIFTITRGNVGSSLQKTNGQFNCVVVGYLTKPV